MSTPDVPAPVGTSFLPDVPAAAPSPARSLPTGAVVVLAVVGVACLIAMVPMFSHGVAAHAFPSYVQGDPSYEVRRYSAPWIGGAVALGGLGVVCWAVAAGLVLRAGRSAARESVGSPAAVPAAGSAAADGLAPRPTEAAGEY